jgi:prepilin-type N-terminal cleavage/methylation domain-containing protein
MHIRLITIDAPSSTGLREGGGFTLLEIIVSLALLGLIAAIFGMGLVAALQSHEFSRTNVDLTQKSQLAMTRMQRELMELIRVTGVTDDQATPGINRFIIYERMVSGANQSTVRFGLHHYSGDHCLYLYTNLDANATQLDGSTIVQGDRLIDGVRNMTFECFKGEEAWDDTSDDPSLLSTIRITLDLVRRDNPDTDQRFQTVVHMRNNNNTGGNPPASVPATQSEYNCFIGVAARTMANGLLQTDLSGRKGM